MYFNELDLKICRAKSKSEFVQSYKTHLFNKPTLSCNNNFER